MAGGLLGGGEDLDVLHDERAHAFVGEHLGEDAVRQVVREDVDPPHAAVDRRLDGRRLGQHAGDEPAFVPQPAQAGEVGVGDQRARVGRPLQDARRAGHEQQLLRLQGHGQGGRHRVGVDVEQGAVVGRREGADHRHVAGVHQLDQHLGVDAGDVAHEAVIHHLLAHPDRRALAGLDQAAVHARDSHRRQADAAADREQVGVDRAVEDHGRDLQGLGVGDAPALDEARLASEGLGELRGLRAAAVDEHDADAHLVEHLHLLDQGARRGLALQGAAAGLQDEGLALEDPDVGDRVLQGRRFGGPLSDVFHLTFLLIPGAGGRAPPSAPTCGSRLRGPPRCGGRRAPRPSPPRCAAPAGSA